MSQEQQRFDHMGENMNPSASIIDNTIEPLKMMSFEEICPQWSFALTAGVSPNPYLDIKEGKNCIVVRRMVSEIVLTYVRSAGNILKALYLPYLVTETVAILLLIMGCLSLSKMISCNTLTKSMPTE